MNHTIRRQLLELNLDGKQPPFDLQNRLNDDYYHTLLPILEKWFDDNSTEDETLYIDHLVIDLGAFRSRDFNDQELKDRLIDKLKTIDITHSSNTQSAAIRRSARHNAHSQWLFYMEKGYLPWNLLRITKEWENKVLETLAVNYEAITQLKQKLLTQTHILIRITLQHDAVFLTRLIEILTARSQNGLTRYLIELHQLLVHISQQEPLSIPSPAQIWQGILALAAASTQNRQNTTPLQLTHTLLTHYWINHTKPTPNPTPNPNLEDYLLKHPLAIAILTNNASTQIQSPTLTLTPPTVPATHPTPEQQPSTPVDTTIINKTTSTHEPIKPQNQEPQPIPKESPKNTDPQSAPIETHHEPTSGNTDTPARFDPDQLPEEGLFASNAGIILAHPFLNNLFKTTRLVANGKFIDIHTQQKAIHLIHYLATGHEQAEEHSLVIPKLICGVPLEFPLSQKISWQESELNEATQLLEGLIDHWGVKNITVEGLRGNFLTRSGKINPKNGKLHLIMEKHAVDILIRTYPLPWNMSIIKLPWLPSPIHLDW
ncbi:MAG: hypothetical protein JST68_22490 [Bacteroidetes bacterium]|nr:hypothetical protein [Bacteroidota bacterium]